MFAMDTLNFMLLPVGAALNALAQPFKVKAQCIESFVCEEK